MKELWLIIGFISFFLGVVGIILPILPTTPFFLLTTYSFTKSSERFHQWFISIPFVQKHLSSLIMTKRKKWILLLSVDTLLLIYIVLFDALLLRILIISVIIVKHYVFYKYVTVIQ